MRCPNPQRRGSFVEGTDALFPPVHVNETGKADVRAPPRNKMALFEQFTIPYKDSVASRGASGLKQVDRHGSDKWHNRYPSRLANKTRHEARKKMKPLYGSSNGSLISSCSAVVNREEVYRDGGQQLAESCPTAVFRSGAPGSSAGKASEKKEELEEVHSKSSASHSVGQVGEDVATSGSSQKCQYGSQSAIPTAGSLLAEGKLHQDGSAACQSLNMQSRQSAPFDTVGSMDGHLPSPRSPIQKGVTGQVEALPAHIRKNASVQRLIMTPCNNSEWASLGPCPASTIKSKDVIRVIGQRLFWSARKTILRQQQILSDQVFELHKLIKVQKLLAKVPTPLTDEQMYMGTASAKIGHVHPCTKAGMNDHEQVSDARPKLVTQYAGKHGDHMSKPKNQAKSLPCKETKAQVPASEAVPSKVATPVPSRPQALRNPIDGQSGLPYRFNGVSAWGYPMGPLNRPFVCSPANGGLPLGSAFGGAYVAAGVGQVSPMAPFSFLYGRNPELTPTMGSNNQWQAAGLYANPFVGAMTNNWYTVNIPGQIPMASGSTKSVPSINMHVEGSTPGLQPAVPGKQPHMGTSGSSRLVASKSVVSQITACASELPHALPKRSGPGSMEDQGAAPTAGGAADGRAGAPAGGRSKNDTNAGVASPTNLRQGSNSQRPTQCSLQQHDDKPSPEANTALSLFPLQPTSSSGYCEDRVFRRGEECRVIKAIPRPALAASESAADILLSLQRERKQ